MPRFPNRPAKRITLVAALLLVLLGVHLALDLAGLDGAPWVSGLLFVLGAVFTVVGVWTDAVERGRTEAERQRLEERLRLSQRLEAVGRLTGGIAHEFNNWLTTILGYGDLLATRLGPSHPLAHEVSEIRRAGRRAASLVDQLLAFSRRQVIAPRVVDLNRLVSDTGDLMQRLIGEDVELDCRFGDEPLRVEADPSQLEQLLVHLAVHARDAMPAGGRLEIRTDAGQLDSARPGDLFEVEPGEYCRLLVTDTGGGFDPDTLGHLFEPFYTNRDGGLGSGLGLASVYGIVKQNRGYIWVDSALGKGTTFSVHLPRTYQAPDADELSSPISGQRLPEPADPVDGVEPEAAAPGSYAPDPGAPEPPVLGPDGRPRTILLVEDEEMVRCLIREVLSQRGYEILEAAGAEAAMERLAEHTGAVDLMLTDVVMPGMPGNALARRLSRERPGLRVLYISGYTESHLTQRGVLPPGERLLQKPFTSDQLLDAVASAIASPAPDDSGGGPDSGGPDRADGAREALLASGR